MKKTMKKAVNKTMQKTMKKTINNTIAIILTIVSILAYVPFLDTGVHAASFTKSQAVSGLKLSSTTYNSVKLKWDAQEGATRYQVYRSKNKNGKYDKIRTTAYTSYTNSNLRIGTKYYYKVRAYSTVKNKTVYGSFSSVLTASPALTAPTLSVTTQKTSLKLSWTKVAGTTNYQIYVSDSPDGQYKKIRTTNILSYTYSVPDRSKVYYFKARVYRKANNKYYYSNYSEVVEGQTIQPGARDAVLAQAISWLGLMEYDKSNQEIVNVYNQYYYDKYKKNTGFDYRTAWCAMYVSAVAIKTDTTDIIPVNSYCPTMLSSFKNKVTKANVNGYIPQPADVVFYDWLSGGKRNGVPDHVGYIVSANSKEIKAIEGNKTITLANGTKTDAVAYRTFSPSFDSLLAYGLPQYSENTGGSLAEARLESVQDTANISDNPVSAATVDKVLEAAIYSQESKIAKLDGKKQLSDMDRLLALINYIKKNRPGEKSDVSESVYNAYLIMSACNELGIDASTVSCVDARDNETAWAEVTINKVSYMVNPLDDGKELIKIVPEEIN